MRRTILMVAIHIWFVFVISSGTLGIYFLITNSRLLHKYGELFSLSLLGVIISSYGAIRLLRNTKN